MVPGRETGTAANCTSCLARSGYAAPMAVLQTLAVANYRSIRSLVMPLGPLTLITGPNGSGKSNLYRALRLLADAAQGEIVRSLAREGGLSSTLWAGPETISRAMKKGTVPIQGGPRKEPVHLRLGFQGEHVGYAIDLGLPSSRAFRLSRSRAHSRTIPR